MLDNLGVCRSEINRVLQWQVNISNDVEIPKYLESLQRRWNRSSPRMVWCLYEPAIKTSALLIPKAYIVLLRQARISFSKGMNFLCSLLDESISVQEGGRKGQSENVKIGKVTTARSDYARCSSVSKQAARNVMLKEERLVVYGDNYEFK